MKCKDCQYNHETLDGCMLSHDPDQDACKLIKPTTRKEEGKNAGKRD